MRIGRCCPCRGRTREALLKEVCGLVELPAQAMGHGMIQFDGAPVCVVRADHFGATGFDLIVGTAKLEQMAQRLTEAGRQHQAQWCGEQAQNILRVEAGVPRYGVDLTEDNLLLEIGLDQAVSFTKGCYLGQEVVERIRSRGHVNRKLCGLLLDGLYGGASRRQPYQPAERTPARSPARYYRRRSIAPSRWL